MEITTSQHEPIYGEIQIYLWSGNYPLKTSVSKSYVMVITILKYNYSQLDKLSYQTGWLIVREALVSRKTGVISQSEQKITSERSERTSY